MEIDTNKLSIAHQKEKVIKIFDDADECVKFAEKFEKEFKIKLSCDPLYAFLVTVETKGWHEGFKARK